MAIVEPPMMSSVTKNAYLRPITSPTRPKTSAPNGRTMKPVAKVARVESNATSSSPLGKNALEMIVARLPKI